MLRLEGVSKRFPGVKALSGIDLSIRKGEVHALLGENGAGKSTLMKILGGIYQADEGRIFIEGSERSFAGYADAIAAGIGIIFQEFSLVPYLNAVENIFLGRYLTNASSRPCPSARSGSSGSGPERCSPPRSGTAPG